MTPRSEVVGNCHICDSHELVSRIEIQGSHIFACQECTDKNVYPIWIVKANINRPLDTPEWRKNLTFEEELGGYVTIQKYLEEKNLV